MYPDQNYRNVRLSFLRERADKGTSTEEVEEQVLERNTVDANSE